MKETLPSNFIDSHVLLSSFDVRQYFSGSRIFLQDPVHDFIVKGGKSTLSFANFEELRQIRYIGKNRTRLFIKYVKVSYFCLSRGKKCQFFGKLCARSKSMTPNGNHQREHLKTFGYHSAAIFSDRISSLCRFILCTKLTSCIAWRKQWKL